MSHQCVNFSCCRKVRKQTRCICQRYKSKYTFCNKHSAVDWSFYVSVVLKMFKLYYLHRLSTCHGHVCPHSLFFAVFVFICCHLHSEVLMDLLKPVWPQLNNWIESLSSAGSVALLYFLDKCEVFFWLFFVGWMSSHWENTRFNLVRVSCERKSRREEGELPAEEKIQIKISEF